MRSWPIGALLLLLATPLSAETELETWSFTRQVDFENEPLGNRFVFAREGTFTRHPLPAMRGYALLEAHVTSASLLRAQVSGSEVPVAFIEAQAPGMFGSARRDFELEFPRELEDLRRVLTQQYADHVILETLGRLCQRDWETIRAHANDGDVVEWSLPTLYDFLHFEEQPAPEGRRITIRGSGASLDEKGTTGPRQVEGFEFSGTLDAEGRFVQIRLHGTVRNTRKRIQQTLDYQATLSQRVTLDDKDYRHAVRGLARVVSRAEQGDHEGALERLRALAGHAGLERFRATCDEVFARIERQAAGVRWEFRGLTEALAAARARKQPVLVLFDQESCPPCAILKREVITAPEFVEAARACVTLSLNACIDQELAERYEVRGTPTLLVLDGEGQVLGRQAGIKSLPQSLEWLRAALPATKPRYY